MTEPKLQSTQPGPPGDPRRLAWLQVEQSKLDRQQQRAWRLVFVLAGLSAVLSLISFLVQLAVLLGAP